MPPLPVVSGWQAVRTFENLGWRYVRKRSGHMVLVKEGLAVNLAVPDHRELDSGTLRSLIRKSGHSVDEYVAALAEL